MNTNYAMLLKDLDVSNLIPKKSLIDKPIIKTSTLYKIEVNDVYIKNIKMPESVIVENSKSENEEYSSGKTKVEFKNIEIELSVSFDIKVGFITSHNKNSSVTAIIDSVTAEYTFNEGHISFDVFNIKFEDIKIGFNSKFYSIIYKIFRNILTHNLNKLSEDFKTQIQTALNKFIFSETILKVPMVDIFFNATNTSKPKLVFNSFKGNEIDQINKLLLEKNALNIANDYIHEIDKQNNSIKKDFLQSGLKPMNPNKFVFNITNSIRRAIYNSISKINYTFTHIQFGIFGRFYTDNYVKNKIPPVPYKMQFQRNDYKKGIAILFSDFSFSTMLEIIQKSGQLYKKFNPTDKIGPIEMNTNSLSSIIPALRKKYNTSNKNCFLTLKVPTNSNIYSPPFINTLKADDEMSLVFEFNFAIELEVQESDDDFDDPVLVLETSNVLKIAYVPIIHDNIINLRLKKFTHSDVNVIQSSLGSDFNTKDFVDKFKTILEEVVYNFTNKFQNIDLNYLLHNTFKLTNFKLNDLVWEMRDGYNFIGFNVSKN